MNKKVLNNKRTKVAKKIQNVTKAHFLPTVRNRKNVIRNSAFDIINDPSILLLLSNLSKGERMRSIEKLQQYKTKLKRTPIEQVIKKVQKPLYIRLKGFVTLFVQLMSKYVDLDYIKQELNRMNNKSKALYNEYLIKFIIECINIAFDIDELNFYTINDPNGSRDIANIIWNVLYNEGKMNDIIINQENEIYKNTMNIYKSQNLSKEWIDYKYIFNRKNNISKIEKSKMNKITKKVKEFGNNIENNKPVYYSN